LAWEASYFIGTEMRKEVTVIVFRQDIIQKGIFDMGLSRADHCRAGSIVGSHSVTVSPAVWQTVLQRKNSV
jgi:hypothetical protein